ncbi:lipopolysaccharide biosynthesis protein [Microvirga sp. G4-2]|uniref:lipopolysaccharide biosynthesis protein n=1 Tax=Microvirga sp. G4-2 TaxID=3434467 RepID=UPI0040443570
MSDDPRSLTERTVVGLAWTSLAMGAQAVMQLTALILLARLLPPSSFGVFAAALVVIGFCTIFSELGVGPAIVQRVVLEPRHIRTGFTLSLLLSFAVGGLIWLGAPLIARFFQIPELTNVVRAISLGLPIQGMSTVALSMAQRDLRFRWLAAIDAGAFAAGFVLVAPALAWTGFDIWALAGAYLTQQALRAIVLLNGQPHLKRPLLEWNATKELLYFGGGFSLARIGNYLAGQGDNLVVGRFLGPQALGLYSHAYQLMASPAILVGQILDRVLFPTMALVQLEPRRLARAYRSGISVCALVILPASIIIVIVADEVVSVLLGPGWSGVADPLRILALGMLFRTSYKMSDSIVRATGAVYARAWRQAVFAGAVIMGSILGQFWGLSGVAVGVLAALGLNFMLMAHLSLRLAGMTWAEFSRAHLPGLVLAFVLGLGTWMLAEWFRDRHTSPVLLLVQVGFFAPTLGVLLCWLMPTFFLGENAHPILRALSAVVSLKLQRRSAG